MSFEILQSTHETLGEYLLSVRTQQGLSVEEVSVSTSVPVKYLNALESGHLSLLPVDVYAVGFLKKLAIFYNAPEIPLIEQFKKERRLLHADTNETTKTVHNRRKLPQVRMAITPKFFSVIIIIGFVLVTIGWLIWQVVGINTSPTLSIQDPQNGAVLKESFVKVKGTTDVGAELKINGQTVFVESDGNFNATLSVSSGQKDLVFESTNKFKKTASKTVSIVVDLPVSTEAKIIAPTADLQIEISVKRELPISLTVDGEIQPTEVILPGQSVKISAKDRVVLLTPDAGNTEVKVNGGSKEVLGRVGQTLTVPYEKEKLEDK